MNPAVSLKSNHKCLESEADTDKVDAAKTGTFAFVVVARITFEHDVILHWRPRRIHGRGKISVSEKVYDEELEREDRTTAPAGKAIEVYEMEVKFTTE